MESSILKALFEYSSLGIIISNRDGIIERANPFMSKIFGYEIDELLGKKVEILIPQHLKETHIKKRDVYNNNPGHRPMGVGMDLKAIRKDGQEVPVEVSISYYEIEGRRHIVNFISDITDRKNAEDKVKKLMFELEGKVQDRTKDLYYALNELNHINENLAKEVEQRKKAEEKSLIALEKERELSEMKSRFVSMASHEFRTPLGGILTSASLIGKYNALDHEEKRQKHVQTIKRSVKNLTAILNDFLSLDKLEQGKMGATPTGFLLNEFIVNTISEIKDLLEDNLDIDYQSKFNEIEIKQDKDMLRNVLTNLLSNAMKYSPSESPITIVAELEESFVKISVQDRGMGIPESEQKYIFTRFFRANNANTIQGTGLGLNIVKRYMDLMEGTVEFESQENIGTTFIIKFPLEIRNEKNIIN